MKRQLIALLAVAVLQPWPLLITGDHWWVFILDTVAILAALRLLLGRQWLSDAGLQFSSTQAFFVVLAFILIATGSKMLLSHVYEVARLRASAPTLVDQTGFLFQAFNEEILFRGILIGLIVRIVPSATMVSLGTAIFFPVAHFLLYRYSNPMHLALSASALVTLFLAGVAMNNLYLAFRHIGFSWALHAGWNVVWLPAAIFDAATGRQLSEPQIFERVLSSPAVVIAAGAMTILSFVLLGLRLRGRTLGEMPRHI